MYSPLYKAESKNPKTRVADANNTIIIRTIKQGIPTYTNKLNPFQIPFIDSHCHLDRLFNLTHYRGTFSQFKLENNVPKNFGCVANFCDPGDEWWGLHEALIEEDRVWGTYGETMYKPQHFINATKNLIIKVPNHPRAVKLTFFVSNF